MKKQLLLFTVVGLVTLFGGRIFSQVGINLNGSSPDPSAMLDVESSNKGLLPPRIQLISTIVSTPVVQPATGLLVYNIAEAGLAPNNVSPGYYHWDGTKWAPHMMPKGINPGDLFYWDGNRLIFLPIGQAGQVLGVSSSRLPAWITDNETNSPTVSTSNASSITQTSFISGGDVLSDGGSLVTAKGICYSTNLNPTITNTCVSGGSGMGAFSVTISGLTPNTLYYARAYAINDSNTVYGNQITVKTLQLMAPTVITSQVTNITQTTAISGGTVTSDGGDPVTFRGVCWDTIPMPTIISNKTWDGSGTGVFISNVTGLIANKTYYLRAYAMNNIIPNTSYGLQEIFTTLCAANLIAGVSIAASANPICSGIAITFTATSENGGTNPIYQWKKNGIAISGATNTTYSYTPANNDAITCVMTSNASCVTGNPATSNSVNITVNASMPVNVSISASTNTTCSGSSVNFTAFPSNGGTTPIFQWMVNSNIIGTNSSTFSCSPFNNDVVKCILISNSSCATSNPDTSNSIAMVVNPVLPVSVSITASQNPTCAQTTVTFTATPVSGGNNPSFQWMVNGSIVGSNSATFSYIPANNDQVKCLLSSDVTCPSGNPATSNVIDMIVNPLIAAGITISASANPVCSGSSVTFTATPVNGGTNPAFQWKKNGTEIFGATNATYAYAPLNNDTITCKLTVLANCETGTPAMSNSILMVVNPQLNISVSIVASENPVCPATLVTFTASQVNGGTNPIYQWKINGNNVGQNTSSYSYIPANGDLVFCVLTSGEICTINNPATSNTVTMAVNPSLPVSVVITASNNPVCMGSSVLFTANPVNGGSSATYQWKVNGIPEGTNSLTFTKIPANNDVISCVLTSNASCTSGNPATSNIITMSVNSQLVVGITIASSANTVCAGTSVTFTATPDNGGSNPVFQWKVNGVNVGSNSPGYTCIPVNNDHVTCSITSSLSCVTSNMANSDTITMVVNPVKSVSISITATNNPVCAGATVTFNAIAINGGTAPVFHWMVNGIPVGTNSPGYSYIPANNDVVNCILTSNEICTNNNPATSNPITMIVNPLLPVSVSITASANGVCAGTTVTYTAFPTNGGLTPVFHWKVNGIDFVSNSNVFNYNPLNNDTISCKLTSDATCATGSPAFSNKITMLVNTPKQVSVSVSATSNSVCAGAPVTFTATAVNGGSSPVYQWKVNSSVVTGATNVTHTFIPASNDAVVCLLTSSETCTSGGQATSNAITMTVNPLLPVAVAISPSANPVCTGSSVTFTATPANPGQNPVYQWKVNNNIVGNNSFTYTYIPGNNDNVSCVLTSDALCTTGNPANSNDIPMTVNTQLYVGSITANQTVCVNTIAEQLNGIAPTNGMDPSYQWQKSSDNFTFTSIQGATSLNYQPDLLTVTTYYRQLQNASGTCGGPLPTNTVAITVTGLDTVRVSILADPAGVVLPETSVTYTATPVNGGNSPVYQWWVNGSEKGADSNIFVFTPVNSDTIICRLTSNESCISANPATSNAIIAGVSNDPPVSVSITANPFGAVCQGTVVTYSATPGNGGDLPIYQWKVNGSIISGATSDTYTDAPENNDYIVCKLTSSIPNIPGNPATSNTIQTSVNPVLPLSVSITASADTVCAGTSVAFTATVTNGGAPPAYEWKVNGLKVSSGSAEYSYIPKNNDSITCVVISSENCTNGIQAISNDVNMVVNPMLPVSITIIASQDSICSGATVTYTAYPVNGGVTPTYHWKVNGINEGLNQPTFSYNPGTNDHVTCVLTSSASCVTGSPALSNTGHVKVNHTLPVTVSISASATSVCAGTTVTFTASSNNGGSLPVFQWKVNDNNVGPNSNTYTYTPLNTDVVTCELTSNATCPSVNPATSNAITITVNPLAPVSVSISASANPACEGTSVVFTAAAVNGGGNPVYQWKINGTNAGLNNSTFSYIPGNTNIVTCVLTSNAVCATGNDTTSNPIVMTINPILLVSITTVASANNVCAGTFVTYTATANNVGTSPVYQWKVNSINVGTNAASFIYAPLTGDSVTCLVTAAGSCFTNNPATSTPIIMSLNPLLPVSVSITSSADVVCAGNNVTFTATPVNGGTNPSYQWKVNNEFVGATASTYNYIPANNDAVTCLLTSNAVCATGNSAVSPAKIITVNPWLPVSVSITASANPVCAGISVTYTATPVNGGASPLYQWKVNGNVVPGATNSTYSYAPVHNDAVSCVLTSVAICTTGIPVSSNTVTMIVNANIAVNISISESGNTVCAGTSVTFTATPTNGGTNPAYQWKKGGSNIQGATNVTYSYIPANSDVITCVLTSSVACATNNPATSNSILMLINPSPPAGVTIVASANPVCNGTSITVTATPSYGGTSPIYQWKVDNTNVATGATYSFTPTNGNVVTCIMTSNLECVSGNPATSNSLPITVDLVLPVSVNIVANPAGAICQGSSVAYTATPSNGGTAPAYQWKNGGTNITGATNAIYTYTPVNGDVLSCALTSSAGCISGNPAISGTITMTVNPSQAVSVSVWASAYAVMPVATVTFYAIPINGGAAPLYQWRVNDNVVSSGATSYSYTPLNNDNIKCIVTSSLTGCLSGNPASSNVVNMIVYTTGTPCAEPTVVHGGQTYNTVQIGTQCWLRENINIGTKIIGGNNQTNNSIVEKYCYNNDTNNCNVYGGLYQWAEMVQYLNGVTNTTHWNPLPTGNVQGVCPVGWHIPTNTEATNLISFLSGSTVAGGKMKEIGLAHFRPYNKDATNFSGFTSLPSGGISGLVFSDIYGYGTLWTITKGNIDSDAFYYGTAFNSDDSSSGKTSKVLGYAVRCLKD
ncbi:MAG: FISUMP domain-containing protein [Bacteroidota bacterium]